MAEKISLAARIDELIRDREGGRNVDFAERIGVSQTIVGKWRNSDGNIYPKEENLKKICEAYGVSRMWLDGYDAPVSATDTISPYGSTTELVSVTGTISATELFGMMKRIETDGLEKMAVIKEVLRDSAEKTAAIKTMADSNAVLADTNSKIGAWAAKQLNMFDELESQGTERRSAREA
ncbi:MAG: helix-turn-helix domain-containing protein [Chitinispirillales bacterium]|jgi:transcriptional regulator with XRE-family HTH domain|nr:helix-turn-helix domain-containing protein [Chitinispirillales bacterium]